MAENVEELVPELHWTVIQRLAIFLGTALNLLYCAHCTGRDKNMVYIYRKLELSMIPTD
jgi:hypothetical protein